MVPVTRPGDGEFGLAGQRRWPDRALRQVTTVPSRPASPSRQNCSARAPKRQGVAVMEAAPRWGDQPRATIRSPAHHLLRRVRGAGADPLAVRACQCQRSGRHERIPSRIRTSAASMARAARRVSKVHRTRTCNRRCEQGWNQERSAGGSLARSGRARLTAIKPPEAKSHRSQSATKPQFQLGHAQAAFTERVGESRTAERIKA